MNQRKKALLMTLPALALLVMGSSVAYAYGTPFDTLTEEQRSALEEARALRKEGSIDEAKKVLTDAGLKPHMFKKHMMKGMQEHDRDAMHAKHIAIQTALKENKYEDFLEAIVDTPFAKDMTKEKFALLVRAEKLRAEGKFEEAHTLLQDAGFPMPQKRGGHMRGEMGHGMRGMDGERS